MSVVAERIEIDQDQPWSQWAQPEVRAVALGNLVMESRDGESGLQLRHVDEGVIGQATTRGIQEMGWKVGYDANFVTGKLPAELAAQVINHRIQSFRDTEVAVIVEAGRFTSFMPSVREVLTYPETAQVAYNLMSEVYGDIAIDHHSVGERGMRVRLMTSMEQSITNRIGDSLGMGLEVRQDYGETIQVELYLRRLICLNGMTSQEQAFSWQNRQEGTRAHQQLFLANGIAEALGAYDNSVERSRVMARTEFEGDPEEALRQRAQAMGFPLRHIGDVVQAFGEEPGNTEWHLMNAFTRVGTHTALPNGLGRRVRSAAGAWAGGFDMVTARMPRPMAVRAGAQIISDINDIGEAHRS